EIRRRAPDRERRADGAAPDRPRQELRRITRERQVHVLARRPDRDCRTARGESSGNVELPADAVAVACARSFDEYTVRVTPFVSTDELFAAVIDERPGDVVTALAHALQCAWLLEQARPRDRELHLAGLVHDVASSLEPPPPGCHAAAGAALVRPLLGDRVAALVAGHVAAKRWLVTRDPAYRGHLSENSRATLARQGEAFTSAQRAAFESSPDFADCILLRRADDDAKVPGRAVPSLDSWRAIAEAHRRR